MGGAENVALLKKLSSAPTPTKLRRIAIGGLAAVDVRSASRAAAELLTSGDDEPGAILSAIVTRENGVRALTTALSSTKIPRDTAKLALRYLQGSTIQDARLMSIFSETIGSSTGPVRLRPEQMKLTIEEVSAKGDASRGEQVFRRSDTNCYQCHAIAGTGGWLAPDLSSIGATAQLDYLINSVLDPNKDIKDGYDGYTVVTKSGDVYSGIKVLQDSSHLVLRDNEHQAIPIPLSEVKAQRSSGSLMPNGLSDPLTHQEFLDLIKFLSELGKPGPYGPTSAQYIRRWRLNDNLSSEGSWTSAYSLVSGVLPADGIQARAKPICYARGEIDVTSPGKVLVRVNDVKGLTLLVDEKQIQFQNDTALDLTRGVHALTFSIDPSQRNGQGLKVEVLDAASSLGHAQAVGGK